jgi:hypothetical protein
MNPKNEYECGKDEVLINSAASYVAGFITEIMD